MNGRWLTVISMMLLAACVDATEELTEKPTQGLPDNVKEVFRRSIENLVFVEGGGFQMGDMGAYITRKSFNEGPLGSYEFVDKDHPDAMWMPWVFQVTGEKHTAKPVHKVTLSSYSISKYEATLADYEVYAEANDLPGTGEKPDSPYRFDGAPAVFVNWHQASGYCQWLAEMTGHAFSLPTEAQWEYAARSRGQDYPYATDTGMLKKHKNIGNGSLTGAVGTYPPNPLGLYDMSGNVEEWVKDWFDPDYYARSPEVDPQGPEDGTEKVMRGGEIMSFNSNNVFQRGHAEPDQYGFTGIRCVVNEPRPIESE